jgi:hypothetical protein
MCQNELPRVYELRALIVDPKNPDAYFADFDASLQLYPEKKAVWLAREREFQRLDPVSWSSLKQEARPYLTKRDSGGRGWEQLVAVLNQARAYAYLVDLGCADVRFIPRASQDGAQMPDVEGRLQNAKVVCEVKTINASAAEIARRNASEGSGTTAELGNGFLDKLSSTLALAHRQLLAYDPSPNARRIAFLVLNFDDRLGEYKTDYYKQIDQYLAGHSIPGLEVAFYNQRTAFHASITMRHAKVVNEAA